MKKVKVSILIVNFNGEKILKDCLNSIKNQTFNDYETIIVDNNSQDKSLDLLKKSYSWVKVLGFAKNTGFAEGNNLGAKEAKGEYILLLNSDAEFIDKEGLKNLVNCLDNTSSEIGVVVPKILSNKEFKVIDSCGACFNQLGYAWGIGFGEKDRGQYDNLKEIPAATACCLLFRKSILNQTFLFPKDFFMYYEEIDFSIRLREKGYKIYFCPKVEIFHKVSSSIKTITKKQIIFKQFYGGINRTYLVCKYYPISLLLKNIPLFLLSETYWNLYFLRNSNFPHFMKYSFRKIQNAFKGLRNRERKELGLNLNWREDIIQMSLTDLLRYSKSSNLANKKIDFDKDCFCCYHFLILEKKLANGYEIYSCRYCGSRYVYPREGHIKNEEFYNNISVYKSSFISMLQTSLAKIAIVFRNYIEMVRVRQIKFFKRKGKLLDVGCGAGEFLSKMKKDYDVYGMDISEASRILCREKGINKFFRGDLKELSFKNQSFDLITANHLLEHVSDPREFVKEINKILTEEGIVYVEIPNFGSFWTKVFNLKWYTLRILPIHLNFITKRGLNILFKNIGFKKVKEIREILSDLFLSFYVWENFLLNTFRNRFLSLFSLLLLSPIILLISILGNRELTRMIFMKDPK